MASSEVKKKRPNKRKAEDITSNEPGDVETLPTPVPCSSLSRETKRICFWGKDNLDGNIDCFVVDISVDIERQQLSDEVKEVAAFDHQLIHSHTINNVKKEATLTPLFSFPKHGSPVPLILNSFATLGSFIYSIGGVFTHPKDGVWGTYCKISGSNSVHYLDTRDEDSTYGWKRGPSMIAHRQRAQVVEIGRKLYVFGCFGEEKCPHYTQCVWAESFDPSSGKWSSLPVPEFKLSLVVCSPTHKKTNRVPKKIPFLADSKTVLEFDIEANSWTRMAKFDNKLPGTVERPVLVDDMLYWFDKGVDAFDIAKEEAFKGPVQDFSFQRVINSGAKPAIFHLGGLYFCLLGALPDLEEDNPRRIHCLIIKVSKTNDFFEKYNGSRFGFNKLFLRAQVVSCQSFPIDRETKFLDGRIMTI